MAQEHHEDSDDTDWDSSYEEHDPSEDVNGQGQIASSKGEEAASERQAMVQQPQQSSSQQTRQISSAPWPNESTPLFDSEPPPPAYSDVTANRPYPGASQAPVRAGDEGEPPSFEDYGKKQRRRRRLLAKLALLTLAISLIIILATTTFRHTRTEDNQDQGGDNGGHDGDNGGSNDGDDDERPPPGFPSNGTWWPDPDLEDCDFERFTSTHHYSFSDPKSFSFIELMDEMYELHAHALNGGIKVTAAPPSQKDPIEVSIWFATTAHYEVTSINVRSSRDAQSKDGLTLDAPTVKLTGKSAGSKSCLVVHTTISLKQNVQLSDFELVTRYCSIRVDPSLFTNDKSRVTIHNTTDITAISGSVDFAHWNSRSTIIDVISGDVSGTFLLNDLLAIKTRSGTIDVAVLPQKIDPQSPAPAKFTADTTSGNIVARFPTTGSDLDVPNRDYQTRVDTKSGTVRGTYMIGSKTSFTSVSGTLELVLLPYSAASADASSIRTETISGTTRLNVLSPFHNDGSAMGSLNSWHKTISASIGLAYPSEWEGTLAATTVSASILVKGDGVKVVDRTVRPGRQSIVAVKGDGKSKAEVSSISGWVEVIVGELE